MGGGELFVGVGYPDPAAPLVFSSDAKLTTCTLIEGGKSAFFERHLEGVSI